MGTCNSKEIIQCSLTNGMIIELILPPDYNDSTSYPIMLFNDGETVFSGSGLNAKFTIDKLIKEKSIKPIITVAVYASGKRNNLYIPYDDDWITRNWGAYKPQAEQYYSEIINVLIPFIDERFSIDKNEIGIGGVSLGGLVSTWMGLKYPEKIKYSASLSGSFWVDDYRIFNEVRELGYNFGNKFWFDIGATTGEWNYYVPLYSKLDSVGVTPGEQSFYFEEKDAEHIFPDWRKRLELPLKIFFGTTDLEAEKMNVVLECIDSSSTLGLRFRRMNPIITLSNKAKFSLAHAATYKLLSGNGLLGSEGSFANDSGDELKVLIEYKEFSEQVTIPSGFCQ
ncbi:MAG: hypothetical protein BalsKO_03180 [Balneolaceae bacterium]